MVFTLPRETEITGEVVADFIKQHQLLRPLYLENKNMYEGHHAILDRQARDAYKPDNRLVVNLAKYIVDTFNGFFIGVPVKESHENEPVHEAINDFRRRSDIENTEAELAKMTSIYGHAYEYLYQDENAHTCAVYNSPLDIFVVYDDTIAQKPLFAVRYAYDADNKISGELYTESERFELTEGKQGVALVNPTPHYYGGVPIIEYIENEERQSVFENVKTLINALNNALSAKADDVEYFADAYLKIVGAELDETTMADLRANRTINLSGDGSNDVVIEFLAKPSADQTQENLIDRLLDLIYQIAMVANINDERFGNASGVALEFKLQPMRNLAIMKERKFKSSIQERYKMVFALPTNIQSVYRDEWLNIKYQFTRNIPRNIAEEAQVASQLNGLVSQSTMLSTLSIVDDVKDEIAKIDEEGISINMSDFELSNRLGSE